MLSLEVNKSLIKSFCYPHSIFMTNNLWENDSGSRNYLWLGLGTKLNIRSVSIHNNFKLPNFNTSKWIFRENKWRESAIKPTKRHNDSGLQSLTWRYTWLYAKDQNYKKACRPSAFNSLNAKLPAAHIADDSSSAVDAWFVNWELKSFMNGRTWSESSTNSLTSWSD